MITKLKKTIISTLVISVFLVSFLCCCLTRASHASSADIKSASVEKNCHSGASESTDSTDTKDCECEQTAAILKAKGFSPFKLSLSLDTYSNDLFSQSISFSKPIEETAILTEHSPPIAYKKAVPLYLKNSIFRL